MRKKTRVARALSAVLTPEQYARTRHDTPYLYTLGSGEDALTFVGARHSNDPYDKLFSIIPEHFDSFKPDVVAVEGVQSMSGAAGTERFIAGLTRQEAITRGGESIFTIKHALEQGVPWFCPEPSDAALMRHLVLHFYDRETLVAWYVLRLLGQYHRRAENMPFVAYVAPFLSYLEQATSWSDVSFTYNQALETAAAVLSQEPNLYNADRAIEYTDPIPWSNRWEQQTVFNEITRTALAFRDRHIIKRISDELLRGQRVLVVYGAGHAVMQEPAYRLLLNAS
ncbi:hypothetical protein CL655_00930 [bacterium]|nr:hypothetical protein [bacterium]|tara:strand:+ start:570 stop:1415 length:846 start_codon:yes stop_codon:yes gene_type:complete